MAQPGKYGVMDAKLISALNAKDAGAARAYIEDEDDPARVLAMYHGAVRHLYWANKDLPTIVALGPHALAYGQPLDDHDLVGMVKAIAYDLGSFCWPGWDEPGITVDADALAFGTTAAALNIELAERLDRPADKKAIAHWLVGAFELANGRRDDAVRSFEAAASHAHIAGDHATEVLVANYAHIARQEPFDASGLEPDLVAQLETARRVFG